MRGALLDLEDDLASDHRVGELGRGGRGGFESRDDFAAPHHRDAIRQAHDLAQLVRDEDDRLVLRFQHPQHGEQLVRFGRREHRGRLVEHQDFGAAHERLQDFDALLQPDREFAHDRVGIDLERVFLGQMRELHAYRRRAAGEQRAALGAEHDVFEHAERRHQHEMLMHHADAVADRLLRGADANGFAVDADLAGVRLVEAVEDRHQRRFSGAVLADDAVNDPALDDEIDVLVGAHGAETLVDADQLDRGRGWAGSSCHAHAPQRRHLTKQNNLKLPRRRPGFPAIYAAQLRNSPAARLLAQSRPRSRAWAAGTSPAATRLFYEPIVTPGTYCRTCSHAPGSCRR